MNGHQGWFVLHVSRTISTHLFQNDFLNKPATRATNSFGRDDLPLVSLLTKQAWEFILNTESKSQKEDK